MLFLPFSLITVLQNTLLVRHPKTGKLVDNFDPKVTEVIADAKRLLRMGLEVPKPALLLVKWESEIKTNHLRLEVDYNTFLKMDGYRKIKWLVCQMCFCRPFWQTMSLLVRTFQRNSPAWWLQRSKMWAQYI